MLRALHYVRLCTREWARYISFLTIGGICIKCLQLPKPQANPNNFHYSLHGVSVYKCFQLPEPKANAQPGITIPPDADARNNVDENSNVKSIRNPKKFVKPTDANACCKADENSKSKTDPKSENVC